MESNINSIRKSNVIISDYEFISPILELDNNCQCAELCIKENEFKVYNIDEYLFDDIRDFRIYNDNNDINNKCFVLIYRFLSYALLDNKPINIKSALS